MEEVEPRTPPLKMALAWIVVAIPLGWGVYKSVVNSLPLFQWSGAQSAGTRDSTHPTVPAARATR